MSQTILIEDNEDIRNLFTLNLQTYAGTDVIHRQNATEAVELMKILPTINLIITRKSIEGENSIKIINDYVKENNLTIPIICMGECEELAKEVKVLKEPILWENLVQTSAKLLGINPEEVSKRIKPDYVPVHIKFFYEINEVPCDVYIRIKQSPTEFQYVKRIHSKDTFERKDIEKYEDTGLNELYVPKDYEQFFVNFVSNNIIKKMEGDLDVEERIVLTSKSYDLVNDQVIKFGIDEATADLSDASITSMVKSVKESPRLNKLLGFLFTSQISYAYQRCHMTSVICHYILSKLEINKPKHLEILSFVSFFSDITLKTRKQIEINSQEQLDSADLSDEDKLAVIYHARDAAKLMGEHPSAPEGIDKILLETHGNANGIGFNDDPPEDLHNLSKIFICADAFVKKILNHQKYKDKQQIIDELYDTYKSPSFQKIIKVLEQKIE